VLFRGVTRTLRQIETSGGVILKMRFQFSHVVSSMVVLAGTMAAPCASGQTFFSMDYSSAASPNGGWYAKELESKYARTRVAGAGPTGQDVYELVQRYAPGTSDYGGQFSWGWDGNVERADPAQGSKRYYRWRMRFSPETNFRGINWTDGSPSGMQNKLLIVGNTCGSRCRFILSYQAEPDRGQVRNFRIQLDGGADLADTGSFPIGEWLNIQVELDSSTTSSTSDGGYKIWINNDNYGAPTAQRTGITLNPTNWKYVILGGFMNDGLRSDGVHTFRQTDFQASTSFDAGWNTGENTISPRPPTNVVAD